GVGDARRPDPARERGDRVPERHRHRRRAGRGRRRARRQGALPEGSRLRRAPRGHRGQGRPPPRADRAHPRLALGTIALRARRGGRAVECGGLENRYPSLGGSRVQIPHPPLTPPGAPSSCCAAPSTGRSQLSRRRTQISSSGRAYVAPRPLNRGRRRRRTYFTAITSIVRMSGADASSSSATLPSALGISPLMCAWRASSVSNVSKIPYVFSSSLNAYQVTVPPSCAAMSRPLRRKAARSSPFPALASSRARNPSVTGMTTLRMSGLALLRALIVAACLPVERDAPPGQPNAARDGVSVDHRARRLSIRPAPLRADAGSSARTTERSARRARRDLGEARGLQLRARLR